MGCAWITRIFFFLPFLAFFFSRNHGQDKPSGISQFEISLNQSRPPERGREREREKRNKERIGKSSRRKFRREFTLPSFHCGSIARTNRKPISEKSSEFSAPTGFDFSLNFFCFFFFFFHLNLSPRSPSFLESFETNMSLKKQPTTEGDADLHAGSLPFFSFLSFLIATADFFFFFNE